MSNTIHRIFRRIFSLPSKRGTGLLSLFWIWFFPAPFPLIGQVHLGMDARENTRIIQEALNQFSGTGKPVVLPAQRIPCGSLQIPSTTTLILPEGCVLEADTHPDLFPEHRSNRRWYQGKEGHHKRAFLVALGATGITVKGNGTIRFQGSRVYQNWKSGRQPYRWMGIWFQDCKKIRIDGIRLEDAPSWMQLYQFCSDLHIEGIRVENFGAKNNDGLDLDGCKRVVIRNCDIHSDDDALVLKSLSPEPMCHIRIENCRLSSNCNALKVGTETEGRISHLTIRDIQIMSPLKPSPVYQRQIGLSGLALLCVDGGSVDHILLHNLAIRGVRVPVFIRAGVRNRRSQGDTGSPGKISQVTIRNVQAYWNTDLPCHMTEAIPGQIRRMNFSNWVLNQAPLDSLRRRDERKAFPGFGFQARAYPEATAFGSYLPVQEFYFFCQNPGRIRRVGPESKKRSSPK